MVVHDFSIFRTIIGPSETDAPLVVDPNRMLPCSVTGKSFESVGWWGTEIVQLYSSFQHSGFADSNPKQIGREAFARLTGEHLLHQLLFHALYHDIVYVSSRDTIHKDKTRTDDKNEKKP